MGKLKPIGSEKLQGVDKIKRILEISNYNLNTPNPINEDSSNEYRKTLADGNTYHIIKEKTGYVIKKGLYESTAEYIEPIKNRKFYPSYSQALKRLNLITKEININEGQVKNISLFTEGEDVIEYYLDMNEQEELPTQTPTSATVPAPSPAPTQNTEPMPEPSPEIEEPMPEPVEEPMDDEGEEDEEKVTFKSIQKLVGKLAQKIRTFMGDEENEMTSEDTKYVINSILSALDLTSLDDEDLDEIMAKFEGEEGEEMVEPEMETPETPEMETPETPEMETTPPLAPEGGEVAEYRKHGARKNRHEMKMEEMIENMFNESKVDKVLSRYFGKTPKTKLVTEQKRKNTIIKIQNLSDTFKQEVNSVSIFENYNDVKFLGKNQYGYLVFETEDRKIRVSPKGQII